ncbi:galactokinase [Candidatus Woesebacteria bacterium]|nr:galactokinase [Candidatus Woesebacteria bacterium]
MDTKQLFKTLYGNEPQVISQAPGRAEIIGNHTDYNSGYALSAAINRTTISLISKRDDRMIHVMSEGYGEEPSKFSLDELVKGEHGNWLNYVKGVIAEVKKVKPDITGMNILIDSDVPSSGGVSSSAAFELSLMTGMFSLFGIEMDPVKKAHLCQKAENGDLIGIPCGFLDQASSGLTKKDNLLFLDFMPDGDMPISAMRHIPIDLSEFGMSFVVIVDPRVKRNLGTSGYPARRALCEKSVPILATMLEKEIRALRDVSVSEFESCREKLDAVNPVMRMRVEHIVYENQRVIDSIAALEAGNIEEFGSILTAAGKSALELYELDAETPELTKLVVEGRKIEGVVGMRNMGGGFSAIALALVRNENMETFEKSLRKVYGLGLEFVTFTPEEGATIIRNI